MGERVVFAVPWRVWVVLSAPLPVLASAALADVAAEDHPVFRPWGAARRLAAGALSALPSGGN